MPCTTVGLTLTTVDLHPTGLEIKDVLGTKGSTSHSGVMIVREAVAAALRLQQKTAAGDNLVREQHTHAHWSTIYTHLNVLEQHTLVGCYQDQTTKQHAATHLISILSWR